MYPGHISDVPISPEDIVERNLRLFHNPDVYYETVHSYHRTRWEIEKEENKKKLRKVFDEFPYDKSVEKQCAYWMRAVTGIHPFPDANHRTATATLLYVLNKNGFDIETLTEDAINKSVKQSKRLKRGSGSVTVTVGNLREGDVLFELWRDYFRFEVWKRYFGSKYP